MREAGSSFFLHQWPVTRRSSPALLHAGSPRGEGYVCLEPWPSRQRKMGRGREGLQPNGPSRRQVASGTEVENRVPDAAVGWALCPSQVSGLIFTTRMQPCVIGINRE